jgi:hypothetical protein
MAEPYFCKEKRAAETDDHPLVRDAGDDAGSMARTLACRVDALRSPHNARIQTATKPADQGRHDPDIR